MKILNLRSNSFQLENPCDSGSFQSVYTKIMHSGPKISFFSVNQFCLHDMKQVLFVLNMHS